MIGARDREIVRELAKKQLEVANSLRNDEIMRQWRAQAEGRREKPTVRFLVSNFPQEAIEPRLRCEGEEARQLERKLLSTMAGRDLFDDDTPISDTFDIGLRAWAEPFGISPQYTRATEKYGKGFHIDPVINDFGAELDKFRGGKFTVDLEGTEAAEKLASDVLGDLLKVRRVMHVPPASMTNPIVNLTGMENYYIAMYDDSEAVHQVMDMACRVYEGFYDYLEEKGLIQPTNGTVSLPQESFAFTDELPSDKATKLTDCWGFMESQETTAVSPETFGEFVFPYQDRLAKRFGLLSYGCCERVDAIFPGYLSKWKHLRKLSVSPFNNEPLVGEYLRGSQIVYYSKPRSEHVCLPGPLNEKLITEYFKGVAKAASGCILEVAQRECGTIYWDAPRAKQYVDLAKHTIEKYWQP